MHIDRDDNGKWTVKEAKNTHASYCPALEKYLNTIEPFFSLAKQKCEFEFIRSLLRVKGISGPGWDAFETLQEARKAFYKISKKFHNDDFIETQYALLLYGLILEASEPYEILANLINVIDGKRFSVETHYPDHIYGEGRRQPKSPKKKWIIWKKWPKKQN